MAFLFSLVAAK